MEKKIVAIDYPIKLVGLTMIPVVHVSLMCWHNDNVVAIFCVKQPVGVIVASPTGKKGYRITGEEVSIGELVEESPDLKEIVERF